MGDIEIVDEPRWYGDVVKLTTWLATFILLRLKLEPRAVVQETDGFVWHIIGL